jgi:hypothetical protein
MSGWVDLRRNTSRELRRNFGWGCWVSLRSTQPTNLWLGLLGFASLYPTYKFMAGAVGFRFALPNLQI